MRDDALAAADAVAKSHDVARSRESHVARVPGMGATDRSVWLSALVGFLIWRSPFSICDEYALVRVGRSVALERCARDIRQ